MILKEKTVLLYDFNFAAATKTENLNNTIRRHLFVLKPNDHAQFSFIIIIIIRYIQDAC